MKQFNPSVANFLLMEQQGSVNMRSALQFNISDAFAQVNAHRDHGRAQQKIRNILFRDGVRQATHLDPTITKLERAVLIIGAGILFYIFRTLPHGHETAVAASGADFS